LANHNYFVTFAAIIRKYDMKSSEFHRRILQSKQKRWRYAGAEGSHYIYEDETGRRYPVPYHGAKEIPEPLHRKIAHDMGI